MKIKEMIELLQKYDPETEFEIIHSKSDWSVADVKYVIEDVHSRQDEDIKVLGIFMK
jgi:hypothetical protein